MTTSSRGAIARVGTSGWDKDEWKGAFYPHGLPRDQRLRYASRRLATLEINVTFRGPRKPADFVTWRETTPDAFVFAVKGPQQITHHARLQNVERALAEFLVGALHLGPKLGPLLWQVPPTLVFQPQIVGDFLALLPHSVDEARHLIAAQGVETDAPTRRLPDRPLRHCFEARNETFRHPSFAELLRRHDVAAVLVNSPGNPAIDVVTSDFAYARLHAGETHYPDGYDDAALEEWAAWARKHLSGAPAGEDGQGRDVFVYFDNPDHDRTSPPFDAMQLQRRIGGSAPAEGASMQVSLF